MEGLRQYMLENGLTQTQLGAMFNVSQPTVSDWLNGNSKPTVERLFEISEKLGISVEQLVRGSH